MEPYQTPNSDYATPDANANPAAVLPQCGVGISSFILSIISLLSIIVLIGVAGYFEATTPGGMDETSPQAIIVGLLILVGGLIVLVALVLGIISVCRKNVRKLFGILGLVFSLFTFLATVGIMLLGLAVS